MAAEVGDALRGSWYPHRCCSWPILLHTLFQQAERLCGLGGRKWANKAPTKHDCALRA